LIVYDSTTPAAIPRDAAAVLAYVDGAYAQEAAVRAMFPAAAVLTVTTTGLCRALICDVEHGDATPRVAAAGVRAGWYRTVYSALATKPALDVEMGRTPWTWFAADPTGTEHIVPGSVATQYAWPGRGSPGHYDISVTDGTWPLVRPPTPPQPTEAQLMHTIQLSTGRLAVTGASPAGHVLVFTSAGPWPDSSGKEWSVIDVTDTIPGATYVVQP